MCVSGEQYLPRVGADSHQGVAPVQVVPCSFTLVAAGPTSVVRSFNSDINRLRRIAFVVLMATVVLLVVSTT